LKRLAACRFLKGPGLGSIQEAKAPATLSKGKEKTVLVRESDLSRARELAEEAQRMVEPFLSPPTPPRQPADAQKVAEAADKLAQAVVELCRALPTRSRVA
jgi:hypothetical protein